ncbi:kinesin-like protein KIN-7C, mitochondrial isoform X2 [Physcomitrium patens]|uniref:Kinesin motor domain-containing protein n=1 Tax=Physcomitrium patens TaxID=3218 RepID=A0A2K1JQV3_PHYPA|nr:kinesin-like protein KIN-7C, mitochondrial isoform X2 [Physcomitrium patens]PNR43915.1 hypothetical protein PHYPA_016298 [Physcomitrium patens]|eukprot:XP_024391200.1 kinesin-like protein KIN-7C, mitochondrial isoform X2 [Physcomitrella patens]
MASSPSKPRTSSPFRFRKTQSVNASKTSPSSSGSQTPTSAYKAIGIIGRSLTPSKGRGSNIPTPPSVTPPQKFRHSSASSASAGSPRTPTSAREDFLNRAKENVSVTVRFRPLSQREIQRGDGIAWYADGDTVRSELNLSTVYAFDRVFGPATTTRGVYDAAAQHVVSGAMEGVNGTVFAYGVTSSGKTHTMHGDQKSPGIIPLAVKDVFSIIQETPSREFLLRVSYLEIYNEVINDLLDPIGQNLRVREDGQAGTYVEGIKEEVVLSPAHALSLIAAGEEHRHVGSNNFNLLSSRSHTIFTMTVESSPRGDGYTDEDVTLSQLNLIDLAGSESSKTETTGLRRKEGSYINKSLLTLGTVIAKLSDGKASHIPYRDSKLTRLLQSSLSGHGRISLICTITPATSNNEETHNTLKFAHRAKRIEIHASSNRILDEKSLIKKYQKEITSLKEELEQVKRGIMEQPYAAKENSEDLAHLRKQSRLEEEEQAKAALMGRIQRLTKLILVSTKNTIPPAAVPEKPNHWRRHSFGEEELAYLPDKRRDLVLEDDDEGGQGGESDAREECRDGTGTDDSCKDEKKAIKKRGMLAWFKLRKTDSLTSSPSGVFDTDHLPNGNGECYDISMDVQGGTRRKSFSRRVDELTAVDTFAESTQAGELFSATVRGRRPPPTGTTMADQMDLQREQAKMLAGEVAFCTSSLKRLTEQLSNNPDDTQLQAQVEKAKEEINEKKRQIRMLEQRIKSAVTSQPMSNAFEMSQQIGMLTTQLNEKAFDLEIKTADNRILQEQLESKAGEINELRETIDSLQQQLQVSMVEDNVGRHKQLDTLLDNPDDMGGWLNSGSLSGELRYVETNGSESEKFERNSQTTSKDVDDRDALLQSQIVMQSGEIENLKQENDALKKEKEKVNFIKEKLQQENEALKKEKEKLKISKDKLQQENLRLLEEKDSLQIRNEKLAEESAYAKELASQAAIELKNLAEEVTKFSFQNSKLQNDLLQAQEVTFQNAKLQAELVKLQSELKKSEETAFALASMKPQSNGGLSKVMTNGDTHIDEGSIVSSRGSLSRANGGANKGGSNGSSRNGKLNSNGNHIDDVDSDAAADILRRELEAAKEKETALMTVMAEKEASLRKELEDAKQREFTLENDLASMWVLVAKLKKEKVASTNQSRELIQNSSQEFQINGRSFSCGRPLDTESTTQAYSKPGNSEDIDAIGEQLARTELHDGFGKNSWSSEGDTTTLDPTELYSSYSNSILPSLVQSRSFGSVDHQPADSVLAQSNPFAVRNGPASKGSREGMRSLEELKSFMDEERRRGVELGTPVSQLKANSVSTASTNPFLTHHVAQQNGLPLTGSNFEGGLWTSFESNSCYKT